MLDEEWIKTLEDGRRVKFTNQELPDEVTFITANLGFLSFPSSPSSDRSGSGLLSSSGQPDQQK